MNNLEPFLSFGNTTRDSHFTFDKNYRPLNHGSFGAFPAIVRDRQRKLQDLTGARPDTFLRYDYPDLLDKSRHAIAPLLGASTDEIVFVPNATTGVNTVLRNLNYENKDVILYFSTIYSACQKTIESLCETTPVESACITIIYPAEDEAIVVKFREAVGKLVEDGKRVKVAMFDTVPTFPGVRFPWEAIVKVCKELGILSLIDGAHGVGHIDLSRLGNVAPDFFTSNCHKWLYVPRGCAILYVPVRNQCLIRTSLPTSHGFQPPRTRRHEFGDKSTFTRLFEKVATIDPTPYICVSEALRFRKSLCGGEARIRQYCQHIAQAGGKLMADFLGTEIMENRTKSLGQCCFVNIRLPLTVIDGVGNLSYDAPVETKIGLEIAPIQSGGENRNIGSDDAVLISKWITERSVKDYDTMIPTKYYAGAIWSRLSGQIYLELEDFEWTAYRLKEICDRVLKGEFKSVPVTRV